MTDDTNIGGDLNDPEIWKDKGNELFRQGDFGGAIKCYFNAIELNPQYLDAWNNLGYTYLKMGKNEEANKCKERIREIKKSQAEDTPSPVPADTSPPQEPSKIPLSSEKSMKERYIDGSITYAEYQAYLDGGERPSIPDNIKDKTTKRPEKSSIKSVITIFGLIFVFLIICIFVAAFVFGIGGSTAENELQNGLSPGIPISRSTTTGAIESATQPTQTPVATTALPLEITETGDDVVAFSARGSSLRIFTMQHAGSSNFIVWLKDSQGNNLALLVNEIGSYSGKKSERLTGGNYYLDVKADGPWTIEITPSVTETSATSGETPVILSGSGDDVAVFSTSGSGLRVFTMQHAGSSNFIVWLKDSQGDNLALLVNEIGSYSGKKSERLTGGDYYLDVTAGGPWTIEIAS